MHYKTCGKKKKVYSCFHVNECVQTTVSRPWSCMAEPMTYANSNTGTQHGDWRSPGLGNTRADGTLLPFYCHTSVTVSNKAEFYMCLFTEIVHMWKGSEVQFQCVSLCVSMSVRPCVCVRACMHLSSSLTMAAYVCVCMCTATVCLSISVCKCKAEHPTLLSYRLAGCDVCF